MSGLNGTCGFDVSKQRVVAAKLSASTFNCALIKSAIFVGSLF